jgi:membrane dipeptidase
MLNRREFLKYGFSLIGGSAVAAPMVNRGRVKLFPSSWREYSVRAVDLVRESVVIDMLGLVTLDWAKLERWERVPGAFRPGDFHKLRESGITVFHPAVALDTRRPFEAIRDWIGEWNEFLQRYPADLIRMDRAEDFARAKSGGKVGIIVGLQNSDHFRTVDDVVFFYGLGQRVSQLTYNSRNAIGSGCKVAHDSGLTAYGAQVVDTMSRIGMAVDISHCGDRTSLDAIAASKGPVLITHSNCRALNPRHRRCKPDEVICKMAARGGVMGITSIRTFVGGRQPATIDDVLDHFDHVAKIAGVEHLGLGSDDDLDGRDHGRPSLHMDIGGLNHPGRIFDLTEGLIRRKYNDRDIRLILGGNFQRALSGIWSA